MSDESRIDEIVGSWRERRDRGEEVDPETVIAEHADLADTLRARFAAMEIIDATLAEPRAARSAALRPVDADRYADFRVLGQGGMGIVYWALDTDLNRQVAFKVVRPDAGQTAGATPTQPLLLAPPSGDTPASQAFATLKARFLQEAWVTAGLEHPGIVPVYEVGRTPEGVPYYTMRFVRGSRTLAAAVEEVRGKPIDERLALLEPFLRVCDTIRYAHAHGVVHRDLKPDNVALGEFGEVVVLDWGLAKMTGKPDAFAETWRHRLQEYREASDLKTMASALGTPGYMAPEAALGRTHEVDAVSDVYSLGAILFQILTGRLPYEFRTYGELAMKLTREDPPTADALAASVPPEIAAICARALARVRAQRTVSVDALAADVREWLARRAAQAALDVALAEAGAAAAAAAALSGDALLSGLDRVRSLAERIEAIEPGHPRAAELMAEAASCRGRAIAERERAARARLLRRVAVVGTSAAALAAVGVAVVIRGEQRETQRALDLARDESGRKETALGEKARALAEVTQERDAKGKALAAEAAARTRVAALYLASNAALAVERDPAQALLLSIEAEARHPSLAARNAALAALVELREERRLTSGGAVVPEPTRTRFSPDGRSVAVCTIDGATRLFDAETGAELPHALRPADPEGAALWPIDVRWRKGGAEIVTCDNGNRGTARRWDAATGRQTAVCGDASSHGDPLLSEDGSVFALFGRTSVPLRLRWWDVETGKLRGDVDLTKHALHMAAAKVRLSADGSRVLVGALGFTAVFDGADGTRLCAASGVLDPVSDAAFTPDGARFVIATSSSQGLRCFDSRTGALLRTFEPTADRAPTRLAVTPDGGKLLAAGRALHVFELDSGRETALLEGLGGLPWHVEVSPDGRRAAVAASDNSVCVWDLSEKRLLGTLRGHASYVQDPAFSPDGSRVATTSRDGTTRVWRVCAPPETAAIVGHGDVVVGGSFSGDGELAVTVGLDRTARVWDVRKGRLLRVLGEEPAAADAGVSRHSKPGRAVDGPGVVYGQSAAFASTGRRIAAYFVGPTADIRVLDADSGEAEIEIAHDGPVYFRGDRSASRFAVVGATCGLHLCDGDDDVALAVPAAAGARPRRFVDAAFSPDGGRLAGLFDDNAVVLWDAATGALVKSHEGGTTLPATRVPNPWVADLAALCPGSVTYSGDGGRIVARAQRGWRIDVHRAASLGDKPVEIELRESSTQCSSGVRVSHDGRRVLTWGRWSKFAEIWDADSGADLFVLSGHQGTLTCAAFSDDGRLVATGASDGTGRVWNAATGEEVVTLSGHEAPLTSVVFSPDATLVLTTSEDGTARLWPTDPIRAGKQRAPRELTPEERGRFEIGVR